MDSEGYGSRLSRRYETGANAGSAGDLDSLRFFAALSKAAQPGRPGFFSRRRNCLQLAWGNFSKPFVLKTERAAEQLSYEFDSSYGSRSGVVYVDLKDGLIAFISAYNPFKVQVFSASRLDRIQTAASAMTGIRFVFYVDGKKLRS